jgi:outer membrane protein OmpA-like peptidoglycan-associated protein
MHLNNQDTAMTQTNFKFPRTLSLIAVATLAVLTACSSIPADNAQLNEARRDYQMVQATPMAQNYAGAELRQASEALARADEARLRSDAPEKVNQLAYLAKQRAAIAREVVRQKTAEATIASASAETDSIRLAARTGEAEAAMQRANAATMQANAAKAQADASMRDASAANAQAEAARRESADAQARATALQAQLDAQMKDMDAKQTNRGMVVTLGDVLFDTNRSDLKSGAMRSVEKLATFLKAYPQRTALVEGFTDSTGSDATNLALSARRAEAVQSALVNLGVARDRVAAKGYGEAFPVATNDNNAGRQLNRRVEIVLSDDSGKITPR